MLDESEAATRVRTTCGSLEEYQDELTMTCGSTSPGKLVWTPDDDTPDVVYYQVCVYE